LGASLLAASRQNTAPSELLIVLLLLLRPGVDADWICTAVIDRFTRIEPNGGGLAFYLRLAFFDCAESIPPAGPFWFVSIRQIWLTLRKWPNETFGWWSVHVLEIDELPTICGQPLVSAAR
jgi:hypothetical protein